MQRKGFQWVTARTVALLFSGFLTYVRNDLYVASAILKAQGDWKIPAPQCPLKAERVVSYGMMVLKVLIWINLGLFLELLAVPRVLHFIQL